MSFPGAVNIDYRSESESREKDTSAGYTSSVSFHCRSKIAFCQKENKPNQNTQHHLSTFKKTLRVTGQGKRKQHQQLLRNFYPAEQVLWVLTSSCCFHVERRDKPDSGVHLGCDRPHSSPCSSQCSPGTRSPVSHLLARSCSLLTSLKFVLGCFCCTYTVLKWAELQVRVSEHDC